MKKLFLMMVSLLLIGNAAIAQDKEALKAEKEAKKAAESVLKKAKLAYELAIPNPTYGRKETDFEKLAAALPLVQQAMENKYTQNNAETWKLAADIQQQYYKKLENEAKADPDNEQLKNDFVETSAKYITYCVKYDSLLVLEPKPKVDVAKEHTTYQLMSTGPAGQILQAAQNFSNSDNQDELKLGVKYAETFLHAVDKSHLMSDFNNPKINLEEWKAYAKAFKAQSLLHIEGTPEEKIVAAYKELIPTKYKPIAYQSLANYYRETNMAKQNQYLQEGIDALKDDPEQKDLRANFAMILMQNYFQKNNKEEFQKVVQLIKDEFSDDENAVNAYLMEAEMAFEAKDFDTSKKLFLAAKEKFPNEPRCLLMAARSAWMKAQSNGSKKADMNEAIQLFKQLEAENKNEPELWGEALYILYNNTQQPALAAQYKKYYKAN